MSPRGARILLGVLVWFGTAAGTAVVAHAYDVDPDLQGATIRGQVLYRGALPVATSIPVARDVTYCGTSMPDDGLRVDPKSKGIANVVVSLAGVTTGKPFPVTQVARLRNETCRFLPRTQALPVGGKIEITNADPVLHNTHIWKGGVTFLNVALPAGGRTIRKRLRVEGRLDIGCDAHRFMRASIHVFGHPYFAVTGKAGLYALPRVPSGTYRLQVWHEVLGTVVRPVEVGATGELTVTIELGGTD
ncbi:MAG: carboxypeptidase regulatory-like domain-containing protein [Nitrospirales bacterium]